MSIRTIAAAAVLAVASLGVAGAANASTDLGASAVVPSPTIYGKHIAKRHAPNAPAIKGKHVMKRTIVAPRVVGKHIAKR